MIKETVSCVRYNPGGLFTEPRFCEMWKNKVWHQCQKENCKLIQYLGPIIEWQLYTKDNWYNTNYSTLTIWEVMSSEVTDFVFSVCIVNEIVLAH